MLSVSDRELSFDRGLGPFISRSPAILHLGVAVCDTCFILLSLDDLNEVQGLVLRPMGFDLKLPKTAFTEATPVV